MNNTLPEMDFTYLDKLAMGDEKMRTMILELLPGELEDQSNALRVSLCHDDGQGIFEAGHKLRSSLLFIGNQEALALNLNIEQAAKTGILTEAMHRDADRLFQIIFELINVLKRGTE